jgi:peptide chain release factor subunit 1
MTTHDQIDRIIRFGGDGLPVVSLYVGVEPDGSPQNDGDVRTRVNSLLNPIRALDKDHSLKRDARMSIRGDLERLVRASTEERWKPGMMALFSCSGRNFFEEVSLPRSVRDRVVVDGTPWVRPMLAVLEAYHRMCVLIADDATAQIWELYLRDIREVRHLRDPALRKPDYAYGMAEHRVRNKGEELAKRHYRRVATTLTDIFRVEGFDLLGVGGHPHKVSTFTDFLPRELQDRIAGTFTIDANTATRADVRRSAESIMDRYEQKEESSLVAEIVEAAAEQRWATLGVESCLWAGTMSAIHKLAVQEGAEAPGVVCGRDGWMARSGDICPLCGQPTRATTDVIDELVEAVMDDSGSVKHVRVDTELRQHTVGARLRFPLPPTPQA